MYIYIYFVIMYKIHIIQDLRIINIFKFTFKFMLTSLFVTITKTRFILIVQLFFVYFTIDVIILLWLDFCT